MSVTRLLYRSDSELTGSDRAVREAAFEIATASAVRNASEGVTGALMFVGGVFVQLLEGEASTVEAVFERICRDRRHRRLQLLDYSHGEERAFGDRDMAAFEGNAQARNLFPSLSEAMPFGQKNLWSANMVVELMQKLLAKRTVIARQSNAQWMTATDIAE